LLHLSITGGHVKMRKFECFYNLQWQILKILQVVQLFNFIVCQPVDRRRRDKCDVDRDVQNVARWRRHTFCHKINECRTESQIIRFVCYLTFLSTSHYYWKIIVLQDNLRTQYWWSYNWFVNKTINFKNY